MVLGASARQPCPLGRLDQHSAAGRDDSVPRPAVQVVVRRPAPKVLDVRRRALGQTHHHVSRHALGGVLVRAHSRDARLRCAADSDNRVPQAHVARSVASHIDFDDLGSREDLRHAEPHVLDLCNAHVARAANLHHSLGVGGILERVARAGNHRPSLSDDPRARWNDQRVLDDVHTVWEIADLTICRVISQNGVEGSRVVGVSVALDVVPCDGLDIDDLVAGVLGIGRLGFRKELAPGQQYFGRLVLKLVPVSYWPGVTFPETQVST